MKSPLYTLITVFLFLSLSVESQEKPNVIVIMADDLGYGDVGFNGSTEIPTPNIDRIADQGVVFTNGYTSYCVCGPSRAGFITGRYQQRFGFGRNPLYRVNDPAMGLPLDETTIAESVSKVGYTSGIIGKWHLGAHISNHPLNRGFDEFFGHLGGGHRYFPEEYNIKDSYKAKNESESYYTWLMRNHTPEETDEYITDEFSQEAVDFVTRHKDHPFFLFVSYNAPHGPLQAKTEDLALFPDLTDKRKTYAAMVHAVDRGVGQLIDKLQELNIEENTLIFFLSDNGGPESKNGSDNGVLRGGKSDVYEGGYRVPFAMQWKKEISSNTVFDAPVSSLDIFATLAALSEAPVNPEKPLDGVNLIPYLTGENSSQPHDALYVYKFDQDRHAVRQGDYKLLFHKEGTNKKMYNITTNISENDGSNLYWNSTYRPQRDALEAMLSDWEAQLIHPRFLGLIHKDDIWATEVTISENNLNLDLNASHQLEASIVPNDAINEVIEWVSTHPEVATVDANGLVQTHTEGHTVIISRVIDKQSVFNSCIVKVGTPAQATNIQLSENSVERVVGKTVQLSANVSPSQTPIYALQWSSSNPAVATVDENGFVLTHSIGNAIVSATVIGSNQITAACTLQVNEYTGIELSVGTTPVAEKIVLYPNPVTDSFQIEFEGSGSQPAYVDIYNNVGALLAKKTVKNSFDKIDISNLSTGTYFVCIRKKDSRQTLQIIKK